MFMSDNSGENTTFRAGDPLPFACKDTHLCFTQCCRDVNIFLTPYDVLRLRRATRMGSSEFLARYTLHFLAKGTNIPVVQLAMDSKSLDCKLVTNAGCSVYLDRPWACRMFPLDLGPKEGEYRVMASQERCLGLRESATGTVGEWLDGQGVAPFLEMEREFDSVMPAGFVPGSPLPEALGKLLFLAYDLDRFAQIIKDPRLQRFYEVDEEMIRGALENDEQLLRLAFRYIRSQLEELYQVV